MIQKIFETCGDGVSVRVIINAEGADSVSPSATEALQAVERVVSETIQYAPELITNQYGNYAVQHLLLNCSAATRTRVFHAVGPMFVSLATEKFSSNVAEKLFTLISDSERAWIISQLIVPVQPPPIAVLIRDRYANYVVQKIVELATAQQREAMSTALWPYLSYVTETTFGYHMLQLLEKSGWLPAGSTGTLTDPSTNFQRGGPNSNFGGQNMNVDSRSTSVSSGGMYGGGMYSQGMVPSQRSSVSQSMTPPLRNINNFNRNSQPQMQQQFTHHQQMQQQFNQQQQMQMQQFNQYQQMQMQQQFNQHQQMQQFNQYQQNFNQQQPQLNMQQQHMQQTHFNNPSMGGLANNWQQQQPNRFDAATNQQQHQLMMMMMQQQGMNNNAALSDGFQKTHY